MLATFAISIVLSVQLLRLDFSKEFTPAMAAAGIVPPPPPINPLCEYRSAVCYFKQMLIPL